MRVAEPESRRWTLGEYYRLAEQGWFQGQRVQLIRGEIIQMPAQGHAHATAILRTERVLRPLFQKGYCLRVQMPLNVGMDTDPEPDIAVVPGTVEDYSDHPTSAVMVIEISDTTLRLDRRKAGLYASAGIPEYWIVNLKEQTAEVHRGPEVDLAQEFGHCYATVRTLLIGETVSPLAAPTAIIAVADLLPRI